MNSMKLLLWSMIGQPHEKSLGEPWDHRLGTIGEVLKSDAYDFIVMPGVSAPQNVSLGRSMMLELTDFMPDYSFSYARHVPSVQVSGGLLICHRHGRWESDLDGGFRLWPPYTDRVLFCVLFHELDADKRRTGRAVYVASCQLRAEGDDDAREAVSVMMADHLSKRPHPEYPVIWAGDFGMGEPSRLYDYVTGLRTPIVGRDSAVTPLAFQDPLAILHPEAPHRRAASMNNWRDYEPEGGLRRDFVFISDGLTPHSLDFNYIRTPGGLFPSNHYPQRAVLSWNDGPDGRLLN